MTNYSTFGLTIASDIPLPLPLATSATVDITISLQDTIAAHPDDYWDIEGSPDTITFFWSEAGRFTIQSGQTILVNPVADCGHGILEDSLLGECLGTALIQRRELVLHASAITTDNGARVFVGDSGLGKSTLAYISLRSGGTILSDDLCLIRMTDSVPHVIPGPAFLKVRASAFEAAGQSATGHTTAFKDSEKYLVSSPLSPQPVPLERIVFLETAESLSLRPCPDINAFWALMENSFASHLADSYEHTFLDGTLKKALFQQCKDLVQLTEISILGRAESIPTPAELNGLFED